jgi:hypothetical protein
MLQAIVESLPIALGMIMATLPLIAVPLILLTRRDRRVLAGFLVGYAAGFLVLGGIILFVVDLSSVGGATPAAWVGWLRILLGAALIIFAAMKWKKPAKAGSETPLPGWMKQIDTIPATGALALGFMLIAVNPKNLVIVASGALAIGAATADPVAQIGALVVFTVLSSIGIAAPWLLWLVMCEAALGPLDRLKTFLARYNDVIMSLVLGLLGVVVILNA